MGGGQHTWTSRKATVLSEVPRQQQMAVGHQLNTHSASGANLTACNDFSAALAGQPLVDVEVVLWLLVPHRDTFCSSSPKCQDWKWSCDQLLNYPQCLTLQLQVLSGQFRVRNGHQLSELDPLWNERWGQWEHKGEAGPESWTKLQPGPWASGSDELPQEGQKKGSKSRVHHFGNFHHH